MGLPLALTGKQGQKLKPKPINNAREDKLNTAVWRDSFAKRRCVIPVGEWAEAEGPKGRMTRTWYGIPGEPVFAVAGTCALPPVPERKSAVMSWRLRLTRHRRGSGQPDSVQSAMHVMGSRRAGKKKGPALRQPHGSIGRGCLKGEAHMGSGYPWRLDGSTLAASIKH